MFLYLKTLLEKAGKVFPWLKSVFSEDDGLGSYSRCASGFIVASVCSWVLFLVVKNHAMPDLTGPSAFLTTGVGIHYGTNKASEILSALKGKPGSDGTNPPQQ